MPYHVMVEWDSEAQVWTASSDDVPGLVTEEATVEGLVDKLKVMVPEMLEANGLLTPGHPADIPFEIRVERTEHAFA